MPILADSAGTSEPSEGLAPSGKQLPERLQKTLSRVTEIGSLPEITTKIVGVVEDPRSTAQDMHEIVKNDPALATKILKVVNSAFYGLPAQIGSLDRAIIMLGLSAVKNIALATSLGRLFKGDALSERFTPRDLWRHCIGVGVCARSLAKEAHVSQADEFFVGGLVHDMGLLVVGQLFPAEMREVADRCLAHPQDYCAAEAELLGADHQAFGMALATRWKFPPALCYVTAYHHDPGGLNPEHRKIATLICIADIICGKMKHGFYLTAQTQEVTADMLVLLDLDPAALGPLCEELPEQIEEAEHILAEE